MNSLRSTVFRPPPEFGPGDLFVREPVRPSRTALGITGFYAAVPVVLAVTAMERTGVGPGILLFLFLWLLIGVGAVRGLRRLRVAYRTPDAVGFDGRGMIARCDGRPAFHIPWRYVRRLDHGRPVSARPFGQMMERDRRESVGLGPDPGWLRLWVVDGVSVEGVDRLAKWRRTGDGAALLVPFGNGIDREALGQAVRRHAPQGVRVRL
ncbi:hypothetical protein ACWGJ2_11800 [Streptomyces sp. NPDC054796]